MKVSGAMECMQKSPYEGGRGEPEEGGVSSGKEEKRRKTRRGVGRRESMGYTRGKKRGRQLRGKDSHIPRPSSPPLMII